MNESVSIMVQVNDEHGNDQGWLGAVFVDDVLQLESPNYPFGGPRFTLLPPQRVRIGRFLYPITSYQYWVGNWCWDSITMKRQDACRLLERLLAWGFDCTGSADSPAHDDLLRAAGELAYWEAKRQKGTV